MVWVVLIRVVNGKLSDWVLKYLADSLQKQETLSYAKEVQFTIRVKT